MSLARGLDLALGLRVRDRPGCIVAAMARPPRQPERDDSGAATRKTERAPEPPAPAVRDEVLRRQAGLAERVASFLRDRPRRDRVGLAAGALLIAAAGAALVYNAQTPDLPVESLELAAAQPLTQEVRDGLPTAPGRYLLYSDSVQRDQRGIYHFEWQDTSTPGSRRQASASLMRLAGGDEDLLEVPAEGDPILHLRSDTPVAVVAETAASANATGGSGVAGDGGRTFVYMGGWYPFFGGFTRTPTYMSPSVSSISPGGRVDGSVASTSPPPPASRVVQVPARADAVSGQARGAGGGTAATSRLGGASGRTTLAPARSSGFTSGIGSIGGGASA
jgi:hypothetical protein